MPTGFPNDSALRFCLATSVDDVAGTANLLAIQPLPSGAPMPLSNFPGVALGSAALLPDAAAGSFTLFAIDALSIAQRAPDEVTCDMIVRHGDLFQEGRDYFEIGAVTLTPNASTLVAVGGCAPQTLLENHNPRGCGSSWEAGPGNLSVEGQPVAPTQTALGQIAFQTIQLSPGLAEQVGEAGVTVSVDWLPVDGGDAATPSYPLGTFLSAGQMATRAATVPLPSPDFDQVGITLHLPAGDSGTNDLFTSLAQAAQLVDPTADPATYYAANGTYVVAIVGDPSAPAPFATGRDAGIYDGAGLHVIVVLAQPTVQ
jgi:hypothetical protein